MAEPAADATVSSTSALTSLLNSWAGAWALTIPSGKTASDARYIDLTTGSYGGITPTQTFPQPVWVRSQDQAGGAHFTSIDMDGAANLNWKFVKVDLTGIGSAGIGYVQFDAITDCGLYNCEILGDTTIESSISKDSFGVYARNGADGWTLKNCYLSHWGKAIFALSASNGHIEGCIFNYIGGDEIHFSATNGIEIIDNWGARYKLPDVGEHCDFVQGEGGASSNITIRGNVFMLADETLTNVCQFLFFNGTTFTNLLAEQNICLTNTSAGFNLSTNNTQASSNITSQFNTLLRVTDNQQPDLWTCYSSISYGGVRNDDNIVAVNGTSGGGSGTEGIAIDVGPNHASRDYSGYAALFDATLNSAVMMGAYIPKVGTRAHWDHADPTGAYDRFREIHVQGLTPAVAGWPVDTRWNALYNADGALTSGGTDASATPATGTATAEGIAPTASDGTPMYDITVTYDFGESAVATSDVGTATVEGLEPTAGADANVTTAVGEATAEGVAPDVSAGGNVSVTTGTGDAAAEGLEADPSAGAGAETDVGAADAAGLEPTPAADANVTTGVGEGAAAGLEPSASAGGASVTTATGDAASDGLAPDVSAGSTATPGTGDALAEGQAPDASAGVNASATPGTGEALAEGLEPSTSVSVYRPPVDFSGTTLLTRPEPLDAVCRRLYGDESGFVEPILALNPGLGARPLVLPASTRLVLPDVAPAPAANAPVVVTLWD